MQQKTNLITLFGTENKVIRLKIMGALVLLRLFCSENKVKNKVLPMLHDAVRLS